MNDKVINILKDKNYIVPAYLFKSYKNFGLTSELLVIMIYLMNMNSPIICDYEMFAGDLNMTSKDILILIHELKEKGFIEVIVKKNNSSKIEEYINLDIFYNKILMSIINEESFESNSNIFTTFEHELGRTLSPIEYELINGWIECNYKEEIILAALKEAVFNGVNNFRYIDKILFEWNKNGINTIDKVNKNKKEFNNKNNQIKDVPDYDWLNE